MTAPTLPEFDHSSWRKPRDDWKRKRRHFHCFTWSGPGDAYAKDSARRDPNTELPPIVVKEWLGKAVRTRQSPSTPDEAVEWLQAEYRRYVPEPDDPAAEPIPLETRLALALHDLQCGNHVSWGEWLAGKSTFLSIAVISAGTDCPLHRT